MSERMGFLRGRLLSGATPARSRARISFRTTVAVGGLWCALLTASAGANELSESRRSLSFGASAAGVSEEVRDTGIQIWEEQEGAPLDFRQVAEAPEKIRATPRRSAVGYTVSQLWLRFEVFNRTMDSDWVVQLQPALIDELTLVRFEESREGSREGGREIRWIRREEKRFFAGQAGLHGSARNRLPTFEVDLSPGRRTLFVARLRSHHALPLGVKVMSRQDAFVNAVSQHHVLGLYWGVIIGLAAINLLIFFATREKTYLYFVLQTAATGLLLSNVNGTLNLFFNTPWGPPSRWLGVMSSVTVALCYRFAVLFLDIGRRMPRAEKVIRGLRVAAYVLAVLFATPFFEYHAPELGFVVDRMVGACVLTVVGLAAWLFVRERDRNAGWFLASWLSVGVCAAVYFAGRAGLISQMGWLEFAVETGAILQMLLMSAAIKFMIERLSIDRARTEQQRREAERVRTLFHLTCHDLANPLSIVQLKSQQQLERLEASAPAPNPADPRAESDELRAWRSIHRAASQQRAILDFVRMRESVEVGKIALKIRPVALHEVLDNVQFLFEKRFREKQIEFRFESPDLAGDIFVAADPTILNQTVINNLITNAIKFTRPGGSVTLGADRLENDKIRIFVRDSGVGIPAPIRGQVFSDHKATTRPGTQGETGNGFGLPLVASMVKAMGGEIVFETRTEDEVRESKVGVAGTTFYVVLSSAPPESAAASSPENPPAAA